MLPAIEQGISLLKHIIIEYVLSLPISYFKIIPFRKHLFRTKLQTQMSYALDFFLLNLLSVLLNCSSVPRISGSLKSEKPISFVGTK
jgi:hypothetical protein